MAGESEAQGSGKGDWLKGIGWTLRQGSLGNSLGCWAENHNPVGGHGTLQFSCTLPRVVISAALRGSSEAQRGSLQAPITQPA